MKPGDYIPNKFNPNICSRRGLKPPHADCVVNVSHAHNLETSSGKYFVIPTKGISQHTMVMARKSSLFQSSERFLVLEEVLRWLKEVLK